MEKFTMTPELRTHLADMYEGERENWGESVDGFLAKLALVPDGENTCTIENFSDQDENSLAPVDSVALTLDFLGI